MNGTRCICFNGPSGDRLHGILHEPPEAAARGVCILLLSPGIKGRVGPHRLYLKLAATLVPLGFHVLRFDFHGLGDSEGEIPERILVDMYNSIQTGRYVGDTIAAMNWVERTLGIRRFVGSGLCGGSITALEAAEIDGRIECLLGISLPTLLEGGPENWARVLTQQEVVSLRGKYFRKLADPKSWARLLSGKSSYQVIWRVIRNWMQGPTGRAPGPEPAPRAKQDCTNPRFASAFLAMLDSRRPMLLMFSEADRLRSQFAENFESYHDSRIRDRRDLYEVHVIPRANHVLSDPAWVRELLDVGTRWLEARFPSA
jgi:pimeloyl-ACP methyl ester carboxylesterase